VFVRQFHGWDKEVSFVAGVVSDFQSHGLLCLFRDAGDGKF
jgi:hypothetical protein